MSLPIAHGILAEACAASGMSPEQIRCKTRFQKFVRVRQAIMYALKRRTEWSSTQIARFVGVSDHTTVLHGIKNMPAFMAEDGQVRVLVGLLMMARPSIFYEHAAPVVAVKPSSKRIVARKPAFEIKMKPPPEKFEQQGSGRDAIALNADGNCRYSAGMIKNLRKGSAQLASAIWAYQSECAA